MAPWEKAMKYLAGVLFLASCTILTPLPIEERPVEPPVSTIDSEAEEGRPEPRKLKSKPSPPSPPLSEISSCATLDAGDLKETIKAKLDCIKENVK